MRKRQLVTVFCITVGGVLIPGIANAATTTTTTDTTGSTIMSPVVILAGGNGTTTTDTSGSTSTTTVVVTDKDAKKAAHDATETAKKAAHDADEAAKRAVHDAAEAAKPDKGPKDAKPGADVATGPAAPSSSNAAWIRDPSLFDGTGRTWG